MRKPFAFSITKAAQSVRRLSSMITIPAMEIHTIHLAELS